MQVIELEASELTFLDEDMVHTHFRDGRLVEPGDVQAMFDALEEARQGRKALLLVTVGEGTTMSNEARAFASSDESGCYIAADAIVVRDFSHQLAANVFVRHHKPQRPIRMFPDKTSALDWLSTQRDLIDR
jgi:hypothetical protein